MGGRCGAVHVTGSYVHEVMTWRDVDFRLEVDRIDIPTVFELGLFGFSPRVSLLRLPVLTVRPGCEALKRVGPVDKVSASLW